MRPLLRAKRGDVAPLFSAPEASLHAFPGTNLFLEAAKTSAHDLASSARGPLIKNRTSFEHTVPQIPLVENATAVLRTTGVSGQDVSVPTKVPQSRSQLRLPGPRGAERTFQISSRQRALLEQQYIDQHRPIFRPLLYSPAEAPIREARPAENFQKAEQLAPLKARTATAHQNDVLSSSLSPAFIGSNKPRQFSPRKTPYMSAAECPSRRHSALLRFHREAPRELFRFGEDYTIGHAKACADPWAMDMSASSSGNPRLGSQPDERTRELLSPSSWPDQSSLSSSPLAAPLQSCGSHEDWSEDSQPASSLGLESADIQAQPIEACQARSKGLDSPTRDSIAPSEGATISLLDLPGALPDRRLLEKTLDSSRDRVSSPDSTRRYHRRKGTPQSYRSRLHQFDDSNSAAPSSAPRSTPDPKPADSNLGDASQCHDQAQGHQSTLHQSATIIERFSAFHFVARFFSSHLHFHIRILGDRCVCGKRAVGACSRCRFTEACRICVSFAPAHFSLPTCSLQSYCGRPCQYAHWPIHSEECFADSSP
eukprot:m.273821 g.273821  ORF g.273821 m.273821 type:complete len:539 (-) comp54823_c0_seq9:141-1757(-)